VAVRPVGVHPTFDEPIPIAESIDGLLAWSVESFQTMTGIMDNDSAEEIRPS
jgi:hypothetical protein